MSCLSLRLPSARKSWWKSLTSKIKCKLHKLNKPKAIMKPRNRPKIAASASASSSRPYYKFLEGRFQRKRRVVRVHGGRGRRSILVSKCAAPVYVDKLFKEAVEPTRPLPLAKYPPKTVVEADRPAAAADDMWESMVFASPQMHGIDERAEEFIAKFRAELEVQEMRAREL